MKKILVVILILSIFISGCSSDYTPQSENVAHLENAECVEYADMVYDCIEVNDMGKDYIEGSMPNTPTPDKRLVSLNIVLKHNAQNPRIPVEKFLTAETLAFAERVEAFFAMNKDELFEMLGDEYETDWAGIEGTLEGYHFESEGLTFVFTFHDDRPDNPINFIETRDTFSFNGVTAGMDFAEIKELLGESDISMGFYAFPDIPRYNLQYVIGNIRYIFTSFELDGTNSLPVIMERDWVMRLGFIEERFLKTKKEIFSILNDFDLPYELVETGVENYRLHFDRWNQLYYAFDQYDELAFVLMRAHNRIGWDDMADSVRRFQLNDMADSVRTGMNFSEIQNAWGTTEIVEIRWGEPENVAYKIEYIQGSLRLEFISMQPDGTNSILFIWRA